MHPEHTIRYAKSRGKGIMVSDNPFGRLIIPAHITDDEISIVAAGIPFRLLLGDEGSLEIRCDAAEYRKSGKDNYLTGEKMYEYIINTIFVSIFEFSIQRFNPAFSLRTQQIILCLLKMHSTFISCMNWPPGNNQLLLGKGWFRDELGPRQPQIMMAGIAIPKGIQQVLGERGLCGDLGSTVCKTNSCNACRVITNARARACKAINNSQCTTYMYDGIINKSRHLRQVSSSDSLESIKTLENKPDVITSIKLPTLL